MTSRPTAESYAELEKAYDFYNARLFQGELPSVLFTFQRNRRTYGFFTPERFGKKDGKHSHELAMNPVYFALQPVEMILANLVHNMVHVWQYQLGKPGSQGYHNREFADRMKAAGLHPSDTGAPGGKETGDMKTVAAILCAAGASKRFGGNRKKPFVNVDGRAAFLRSVDLFADRKDVKQILLAISPENIVLSALKTGKDGKLVIIPKNVP